MLLNSLWKKILFGRKRMAQEGRACIIGVGEQPSKGEFAWPRFLYEVALRMKLYERKESSKRKNWAWRKIIKTERTCIINYKKRRRENMTPSNNKIYKK